MVFFPLWEATCSDIWGNYPILIFLNKIFLYLFNSLSSPWPPSLNTCGHYCSLQNPNLPTVTPDIWLWTHRANSFSTNVPMSSSFVIYMLGFFGFSHSPWLFTHIINGLVILLSFLPSLFYYKSLVRILLMLLFSCVQLFVTPWTAACQVSLSFTSSRSLLKLMSMESGTYWLNPIGGFVYLFFNWSTVTLQCCVSFKCTAKWIRCDSDIHMYSFSESFLSFLL